MAVNRIHKILSLSMGILTGVSIPFPRGRWNVIHAPRR